MDFCSAILSFKPELLEFGGECNGLIIRNATQVILEVLNEGAVRQFS